MGDHNTSEEHIASMLQERGFKGGLQYLDRNCAEILTITCDLCENLFATILHSNAHKFTETTQSMHIQRKRQLDQMLQVARSTGTFDTWTTIARAPKTNARDISSVLKHYSKNRKKSYSSI